MEERPLTLLVISLAERGCSETVSVIASCILAVLAALLLLLFSLCCKYPMVHFLNSCLVSKILGSALTLQRQLLWKEESHSFQEYAEHFRVQNRGNIAQHKAKGWHVSGAGLAGKMGVHFCAAFLLSI